MTNKQKIEELEKSTIEADLDAQFQADQASASLKQIREKSETATTDKRDLEDRVISYKDEIQKLKVQATAKEKEMTNLRSQLAFQLSTSENKEETIGNHEIRIQLLESSVKEKDKSFKMIQRESNRKALEIDRLEGEKQSLVSERMETINRLQKEELEKTASSTKELTTLKEKVTEIDQEKCKLESKVDRLENENEHLQTQI